MLLDFNLKRKYYTVIGDVNIETQDMTMTFLLVLSFICSNT